MRFCRAGLGPLFGCWALATGFACGSSDSTSDAGEGGTSTDAGNDIMSPNDSALPSDAGSDAAPCPTSAPANLEDPAVAACTTIVYIAGGDNNTVIVSTDGVAWNSFAIHDVAGDDYINFISVADGVVTTTSLPGVYQSTDGAKTFSLVSTIAHNGFDTYGGQLQHGDAGLLLTDNEGTYVATNDVTWIRQSPFPGDAGADGFGGHYHGAAFGNGHYVVFQDKNAFREWDGTTFFDGTTAVAVASVAFGNGVFVGVGGGGVVTSSDAKTWTAQPAFDGGAQPSIVLFDGTRFLAYDNTNAYSSTNAQSWSRSTLADKVRINAAAFYAGHYFAVGDFASTSALLLSTDGLTWTMAHATTGTETFTINGPRVGIGRILK